MGDEVNLGGLEFKWQSDFDSLRKVLRKHLEDVLPERDYRELILTLIHSVKFAAAEEANALLRERLTACPEVYRLKNGLIVSNNAAPGFEISYEGQVAATHRARLVCVQKLEGK